MQEFRPTFQYRLLLWSPLAAPYFWLLINASIILYSLFLSCILIIGPDYKIDHFAIENYLAYDLITCIIWAVELSLSMLSHVLLSDVKEWENKRSTQIEAVIAVYFLIYSICNIFKKHRGEEWTDRAMLIDVFINLIAYIYEIFIRVKECKEVGDDFDIIDEIQRIQNRVQDRHEQVDGRYKTFENENLVV